MSKQVKVFELSIGPVKIHARDEAEAVALFRRQCLTESTNVIELGYRHPDGSCYPLPPGAPHSGGKALNQ